MPHVHRRALLGAAAVTLASPALGQGEWPNRPVRIIVPFPPGQAADIVTRLLADELSKRWPQRVVVENRAGGAGAPAMEAGARSAPDGYTLINGTSGTLGINPSVLPRIPYDAERDFAAISNVAIVPLLVVGHPSLRANTPQELAALARAEPGQVNVASAGPATSQHLSAELLQLRTGLRFNIVHYRGSGPAIADLIAGTIPCMFDSVASAQGHIRGGRVKAIGLCTPNRIQAFPDVPTLAETIAPGYEAFGWSGLVAPAGTPPEILARINSDVVAILRDPAIAARIQGLAMIPAPTTPAEFGAFVRAEIAKWGEVARAANVRLEG